MLRNKSHKSILNKSGSKIDPFGTPETISFQRMAQFLFFVCNFEGNCAPVLRQIVTIHKWLTIKNALIRSLPLWTHTGRELQIPHGYRRREPHDAWIRLVPLKLRILCFAWLQHLQSQIIHSIGKVRWLRAYFSIGLWHTVR